MNNLRYSTQTITKTDIKAVKKVLYSDWLTQGPQTTLFENQIRKKVNSKYAVAVNSGSSALLLSCKALSLKKGDIFWTVPNTFVATTNCGLLCGAKVDFVDIDPNTVTKSFNSSTSCGFTNESKNIIQIIKKI
jgi:dTDP-4-amino-4,6-dideoxygalactose transaminase